ncbi:hypothetical protein [Streptomyces xantholiticus]|uniref:Uncharacterized protein n=1 Tax=Streptomyces xantholiticus TaxID=68285 RepID=A0ABV1V681_9ACTN
MMSSWWLASEAGAGAGEAAVEDVVAVLKLAEAAAAITFSSRSTARRAGTWQLQPCR